MAVRNRAIRFGSLLTRKYHGGISRREVQQGKHQQGYDSHNRNRRQRAVQRVGEHEVILARYPQ